jgi:hypothetical protein
MTIRFSRKTFLYGVGFISLTASGNTTFCALLQVSVIATGTTCLPEDLLEV